MRRLVLVIILLSAKYIASAQTWEVGGFLGGAGYMGDINPVKAYKLTDPAFGVQIKRNFDGYWSAKLNYMYGKVRGSDASSSNAYQIERNLDFHSPVSELSMQIEFNLFRYMAGADFGYATRKLSPYLFTGVASFNYNPLTKYNGDDIELRLLQTENVAYKKSAISVPYGAGVKYNISGNWTILAELGYRTAFTDYLDDISGRYIDFNVVSPASSLTQALADRSIAPQIGTPGTQRGDFRPRDTYMFAGLGLTYTFIPIKCPTF
jgi:opacity protein-like surface antigen